jgi:hypothetical protein
MVVVVVVVVVVINQDVTSAALSEKERTTPKTAVSGVTPPSAASLLPHVGCDTIAPRRLASSTQFSS